MCILLLHFIFFFWGGIVSGYVLTRLSIWSEV